VPLDAEPEEEEDELLLELPPILQGLAVIEPIPEEEAAVKEAAVKGDVVKGDSGS
jgi:hypothetical protein